MSHDDELSIRENIESINRSLATYAASNARQATVMEEQGKDIASIRHTLEGNGQPGIIKLVDRHEQKFGTLGKAFWIVVGGVVSVVISTAVYVVKTAHSIEIHEKATPAHVADK